MYEYAVETGVEYFTHLDIQDKSEPLCANVEAKFKRFFEEQILLKQNDGWEVVSHNLTMIGNHLVMTLVYRRPK